MASKFELSDTTPNAPSGKVNVKWQFDTLGNISAYVDPPGGGSGGAVSSVFTRTGAVVAVSGDYSASMVTNAVDQTATYSNPAWITAIAWAKITGAPAFVTDPTTTKGDLIVRGVSSVTSRLGVGSDGQVLTASAAQPLGMSWVTPFVNPTTTKGDLIVQGVSSVPSRLGVGSDGQVLTANAGQPLGMSWVTPASAPVASVFTRTGAVVAQTGDYSASMVTNAVDQTATYSNPAWITAIAWSKITGAPSISSYQTPWLQDVNASSFKLGNVANIGVGAAANAAWPIMITLSGIQEWGVVMSQPAPTLRAGYYTTNDLNDYFVFGVTGSTYGPTEQRRNAFCLALNDLIFLTNGPLSERMRITASGNVGVGNSASVVPDGGTSDVRVLIGKTTSSAPLAQINCVGNTSTAGSAICSINAANYAISATEKRIAAINMLVGASPDTGFMDFYTWNAGTTATRMRISASGNVGINCDPGPDRFHVKIATDQNLALQSGVSVSGAVVINTLNDPSSAHVPLEIRTSDAVFINNGTERMRITAAGYIQMSLGGSMKTLSVDGSGFVKAT